MLEILLLCLMSVILGILMGRSLAERGLTASNALEKHQKTVYMILTVITFLVGIFLILGYLKLTKLIPTFLLLWLGAHLTDLSLGIGFLGLGLLVGLELPGWNNPQRRYQLISVVVLLSLPLFLLVHETLPITGLLGEPLEVDNVVLQTTPYTCAPATIATLGRWVGKHPQLTEKDVVKIAGTNRFGTSTLDEIRAMRRLGLMPNYQNNLTLNDLISQGKPALLQVNEPVGETTISHAIALLEINSKQHTLTLANPLYGKQVKLFEQMQGYWTGTATFVN
ncbi:papain-like cysteine protease family protein [Planktothrix sp. FACHB-1365]|uniref:papain-like cysteine protease family protein n=1 Tax=Planktothrix sp. FACHB-1365 TaxID=2692855 RepID=UPI00168458DD|nr:papain-like cysteine protease family protein [Planktothrix sp. FACHB-1365]MBD2480719.1 hypothetical protein [Planktothrix sp. FACHB-1365]